MIHLDQGYRVMLYFYTILSVLYISKNAKMVKNVNALLKMALSRFLYCISFSRQTTDGTLIVPFFLKIRRIYFTF